MNDKKWVEEKARELDKVIVGMFPDTEYTDKEVRLGVYKGFISTLLNEAPIRKPKVTENQLLDWTSRFQKIRTNSDGARWLAFKDILEEILGELKIEYEGMEVED